MTRNTREQYQAIVTCWLICLANEKATRAPSPLNYTFSGKTCSVNTMMIPSLTREDWPFQDIKNDGVFCQGYMMLHVITVRISRTDVEQRWAVNGGGWFQERLLEPGILRSLRKFVGHLGEQCLRWSPGAWRVSITTWWSLGCFSWLAGIQRAPCRVKAVINLIRRLILTHSHICGWWVGSIDDLKHVEHFWGDGATKHQPGPRPGSSAAGSALSFWLIALMAAYFRVLYVMFKNHCHLTYLTVRYCSMFFLKLHKEI